MADRAAVAEALRNDDCLIDAHTHVGADESVYVAGGYPYALSAQDLALRLEACGLGAAAVFPFPYSRFYDRDAFLEGEVRPAGDPRCPVPYALENEALCAEVQTAFPDLADRLLPFAFFDPGRLVAEQVRALRGLAARHAVFGLKTATSYNRAPLEDLLGPGRPLLDLAAAEDWPVMLHTSVLPGDPWAHVDAALAVVRARPGIRFCLAHACRFHRDALAAAAALPNCWVDTSALCIHCRLAVEDNPAVAPPAARLPAAYAEPASVLEVLAAACPERLLWGSDTPANLWIARYRDAAGEVSWLRLPSDWNGEARLLHALPADLRRRLAVEAPRDFLFGTDR